jgi:hypothetical protein
MCRARAAFNEGSDTCQGTAGSHGRTPGRRGTATAPPRISTSATRSSALREAQLCPSLTRANAMRISCTPVRARLLQSSLDLSGRQTGSRDCVTAACACYTARRNWSDVIAFGLPRQQPSTRSPRRLNGEHAETAGQNRRRSTGVRPSNQVMRTSTSCRARTFFTREDRGP